MGKLKGMYNSLFQIHMKMVVWYYRLRDNQDIILRFS